MATTCINTNRCPKVKLAGARSAVAEIVNRRLCGAENVIGMLRWLEEAERLEVASLPDTHQLIYLMEGGGVITLECKEYKVSKGAGLYLGPRETARIQQVGAGPLKLLHLIVPKARD